MKYSQKDNQTTSWYFWDTRMVTGTWMVTVEVTGTRMLMGQMTGTVEGDGGSDRGADGGNDSGADNELWPWTDQTPTTHTTYLNNDALESIIRFTVGAGPPFTRTVFESCQYVV